MKGKPTAVLADLDSTLADTRQRWPLSPMVNPDTTWADYSAACAGDVPLHGPIAVLRLLWPHHEIHIVSGSNASARPHREAWLDRHQVPYDYLRLRGDTEEEIPNEGIKTGYVGWLRYRGTEPVLFLEDWAPAAAAIWEATRVPVLGVNPFYPEDLIALQQAKVAYGVGGGL